TVKWRPISMVGGTVRNRTTTSEDSRRPLGWKAGGASQDCEASTAKTIKAAASRASEMARPLTLPSPPPGARVLKIAGRRSAAQILERITEKALSIPPRAALGNVG